MAEQTTSLPYFRVSTFGGFSLERLIRYPSNEQEALYEALPKAAWKRRQVARSLLKVLLCREHRQVTKDELLDLFWSEANGPNSSRSLDTAISVLRTVLSPPEQASLLRTLRSSEATLIILAKQDHIWVDADAFEQLLAEAMRADQYGRDPLPLLEQAYQLARGTFLEEDMYSDWTQARRHLLTASQHRLWYALSDLYTQRKMQEKAEIVLQSFHAQEPTNEDVLCRLMMLLAQRGRQHEALSYYEQTTQRLRKDLDVEPEENTKRVAEQIRQQTPLNPLPSLAPTKLVSFSLYPSLSSKTALVVDALHDETSENMTRISQYSAQQYERETARDWATWFGEKLMHLIAEVDNWKVQTVPFSELQSMLYKEMDDTTYQDNNVTYTLSRRQALVALAVLPQAFLASVQQHQKVAEMEVFLPRCAASIIACWRLYFSGCSAEIEKYLSWYLPQLIMVAQYTSKYQNLAASLVSQACQLRWLLALQQQDFGRALTSIKQAFHYGEIAQDAHLQLASLVRQAHIFFHRQNPAQQLLLYQKAIQYVHDVSPLLQGWLYIAAAEAHAHLHHKEEAEHFLRLAHETFPEQPEHDVNYSSIMVNHFTIASHEILVRLHLQQPKKAWDSIATIDKTIPTAAVPRRAELTNRQLATSYALNALQQACHYFEVAEQAARYSGSHLRYHEVCNLYAQMLSKWSNEPRVQALEELLQQER